MARVGNLFVVLLVLSVFFWLVESLFAANRDQARLPRRRGFRTDLTCWFITALLTRSISQVGLALILVVIYRENIAAILTMLATGETWLTSQPGWLQALEMLIVGDCIAYWTHRWFHGRRMWKFHAIVSWGFGPLGWLIASPKFHRWHHTSEEEGLDKNFAGLFPFYDKLFGTYYMPKGRLPERFGLKNDAVPEGFLSQLAYPFRKSARVAAPPA